MVSNELYKNLKLMYNNLKYENQRLEKHIEEMDEGITIPTELTEAFIDWVNGCMKSLDLESLYEVMTDKDKALYTFLKELKND